MCNNNNMVGFSENNTKIEEIKQEIISLFHQNNCSIPQKVLPPTTNPNSSHPCDYDPEYLFLIRFGNIISHKLQYTVRLDENNVTSTSVIIDDSYYDYKKILNKINELKNKKWNEWNDGNNK